MASRLGPLIVQHTYRVAVADGDQLMKLLAVVDDWAADLGVASMEVWQDTDDPGRFVEVHVYDSWSHYTRVSQKSAPPKMREVYADMERLIEGGLEAIETHVWEPRAIRPEG